MRTLTTNEVDLVSGAGFIDDVVGWTQAGGALGTVAGYVARSTVAGATRGGLTGAALGMAWGIGYGIGTAAYEALCR